jgi:UDP-N-acetylglucosamine diphosphorylase/glucosamine-1-phosphate N-acetyltransferase
VELYLFDDGVADAWHPFSLTRPCGELLFGAMLLRERLERYAGRSATATLTRDWLSDYSEAGAPPALPRGTDLSGRDRLILLTRAVPDADARFPAEPGRPTAIRVGETVAGCFLPAGEPGPDLEWLLDPSGELDGIPDVEEMQLSGELLPAPWDLIERNPARLAADLHAPGEPIRSALPEGVHVLGSGSVVLVEGVRLEPGVLLDVREGGIRLEEGVEVRTGTRLQGPLWAGPGSRLLGGSFAAVAAGPCCYLQGEVEASVALGYANKAHAGFLGHSYLGKWVNLGALTTTSDLKNNYGPVRAGGPDGVLETGLLKLGCLLGDHARTAIGTLLNTGTVVGAGTNLFGDGLPPKWVAPFSWGFGDSAGVYDRERFLAVAERVMARRDVSCEGKARAWLASCWEAGTTSPDPK